MELKQFFIQILNQKIINKIVFSNPVDKLFAKKAVAKLFAQKNEIYLQIELFLLDNKVKHFNYLIDADIEKNGVLDEILKFVYDFRQTVIFTDYGEAHILVSKKLKVTINDKIDYKRVNSSKPSNIKKHDNEKAKCLIEGKPINFLIQLGIMNENGDVFKKKRSKFNQINNFLQYIDSIYEYLPKCGEINILDLCAGKSYLSFATYYYLTNVKQRMVTLTGVDLKEDVIEYCNKVANDCNMDNLKFVCADVFDYEPNGKIDLVISLHACDIATDIVLSKAVQVDAKVVLSSPCCHHEIASQIKNDNLDIVFKHGILKQRVSEVFTDALRALALESMGYNVEVIEFIELNDTPKNLLIKAIKTSKGKDQNSINEFNNFCEQYNLQPSIKNFLKL